MRADFLDLALGYRPFADALQGSTLILAPMTQEELGRVIEKPAEMAGVSFEYGLVERILTDVGDEPGNLPLLEFALDALWERQSDRQLTHAAYDDTGRVGEALARYADNVYEGLEQEDREKAHHIFVQLVRPGAQTHDTRRLSRRSELGEENWLLAQYLANTRLVVIDRDPSGQETVSGKGPCPLRHSRQSFAKTGGLPHRSMPAGGRCLSWGRWFGFGPALR